MKNKILIFRVIIIVSVGLCISYNSTLAQDFYKDYRLFLTKNINNKLNEGRRKFLAKKRMNELKKTFDTVELKTMVKMLNTDSIFMINYSNGLSAKFSVTIWNKNHSCSYLTVFSNSSNNLSVEVDGTKKMKGLDPFLRQIVEKGDTLGYRNYVKHNELPPQSAVSFTTAVRVNNQWKFIMSKSYSTSRPE